MSSTNRIKYSTQVEGAISKAARKYKVDPKTLRAIVYLESRGDPLAKNPKSSAGGLFQFINSTAKQYGLNDRYNADEAADAGARLLRDNAAGLRSTLGREPTAGELYLAHQQGLGGAKKLLSNPTAKASDLVGSAAVRLNGGKKGISAKDFSGLWARKMDRVLPRLGEPSLGAYPYDYAPGPMAIAKPQPNPDFRPVPTPQPRPAAPTVSQPQTPINVAQGYSGPKAPLNAYFSNVSHTPSGNAGNGLSGNVSGSPVTPSPSTLFMANRTAGLPTGGFGSTPAQGLFSQRAPAGTGESKPDPWSIPADIQRASYNARQALGMGSTPTPTAKPTPSYQSASKAAYQQYGQSRSAEPEFITKTITQQVPKSPAGGMTLDQATQFAYGPSSINFHAQNAAAPPIPTAKPEPEYETVTKQIQVANPNYVPTPTPQPMMAPMPVAKPEVQQQGFFGSLGSALGGMFSPAGTAGGLVGGALGGPVGSVAGNLVGRGVSNVVQGNRGTTNSIGTGNGSGGPYAGQSWRNTSTGGTRVFNPSTRQYEDIGGSRAGQRSTSQTTGSGGGFFSSLFG